MLIRSCEPDKPVIAPAASDVAAAHSAGMRQPAVVQDCRQRRAAAVPPIPPGQRIPPCSLSAASGENSLTLKIQDWGRSARLRSSHKVSNPHLTKQAAIHALSTATLMSLTEILWCRYPWPWMP